MLTLSFKSGKHWSDLGSNSRMRSSWTFPTTHCVWILLKIHKSWEFDEAKLMCGDGSAFPSRRWRCCYGRWFRDAVPGRMWLPTATSHVNGLREGFHTRKKMRHFHYNSYYLPDNSFFPLLLLRRLKSRRPELKTISNSSISASKLWIKLELKE